jgi:sugar phosphate isomerase/epimerase
LVQVSDYTLGTMDMPNRCAIGDGDVPVEALLALLLDAGYAGPIELEFLGPRIEEEGYRGPIRRSLERLGDMLGRLGA